jgi:hypothetical protein
MQSPLPDAGSAAGYFQRNGESFHAAGGRVGIVQRFYRIGSHLVMLEFAGSALVGHLTRSLEHLRAEPAGKPSLTVSLWDSESTGVPLPAAPWDVEDYTARKETWGFRQGPILVSAEFAGESGPQLNLFDRETHRAFYWVPNARQINFWENAAPLRLILHWWLREQGLQLLHAGAVGNANGGVLLGGKGGSGKSTTTLLCVGLLQGLKENAGSGYGLRYASDDYTVVNQEDPPVAYSLYNAAKLHASHLQQSMPALLPAVSNPENMEQEKAVLYLKECCPQKLVAELRIKAILLPRVTGQSRSELKRVSPALGVSAIAPSTLFQMRWPGQDDMRNMVGVIERVPNYRLDLGTNLQEIPELIATLLESRS